MERRELFKILTSGLAASPFQAAQHQHQQAKTPSAPSPDAPRFFSAGEFQIVDRLCEIIIPSDEQSPGAHDARVAWFIDVTLYFAPDRDAQLESWRSGLKAVEQAAAGQFRRSFLECTAQQQEQIVARMARNEGAPADELERMFSRLKPLVIQGYCLSDIGMHQYLGYRGGVARAEFPGCTDHR